ncbi:hypothetical protein [Acaryochloris marina]|uniref:Uncharacterized protein n=1 Tax=Acaryochloris marina (strain MBIC 11017) TaxID=329726 RepID=A8ZM41_ACAM1|nr:hypothetical protein [Acaryochloris marina]ABW31810.1 hypothetical protein AM1_B0084 [Acaryochloris marina MBIC11017]BDM83003.1 hypothetical protein AM10699_58640 [Acaryochloris marina MBIC10699]
MPSTQEPVRGIPLKEKPEGISRCGMSHATIAQNIFTSRWYEISANGQVIGSALDLDFYKQDATQGQNSGSTVKTKELSKV